MKKKILYVTTISNTMSFFVEHIRMLIDNGCTVELACNVVKDVEKELIEMGCKVHNIPFSRNVLSASNIKSLKIIGKIIEQGDYDIIHTHTPNASAITRIAAKIYKNNAKIIYTAHGFHFYKGAPLKNWLLFYPVEKFLARWTDVLLTINTEDYERAKKKFKAKVVEYVPGVGFDVEKFANVSNKEIYRKKIRDMYNIPENATVILSVGELNSNKNHETILKAILNMENDNIYYIICGVGNKKERLEKISRVGKYYRLILPGYCNNVIEYYYASDIFAFPSKREGLGLAALEAMACGLPLITSNVHGIKDYSIDGKTGFCCSPNDVNGFLEGIKKSVGNLELFNTSKQENVITVKKYDIRNVNQIMKEIYSINL